MKTDCMNKPSQTSLMSALFGIAQAITEGSDIHKVMKLVVHALVGDLPDTQKILLSIFNRKSKTIFIENAFGLTDEEKAKGIYRIGEGITGQVVQTGKPMIVPDIASEPAFLNRTGIFNTSSGSPLAFICVPVKLDHEVMGSLSIIRPKEADPSLEETLEILAVIAALIAQAVQLYRLKREEYDKLREENKRLHDQLAARYHPKEIIGQSKVMYEIFSLMEKVHDKTIPVLILGESGTGKELIANFLHYHSPRKEGPFIRFNCAALPESLAESELFGHEKGAYTGAINKRLGRFEEADKGTLFMDEVGELSLAVQAKLLRVLQSRQFERVGSNQTITVDIRLIAATNRDLTKMIKDGSFREDLYYRLNIFPVVMPPLRERGSDILLLADYFVEKYAKRYDIPVRRISTPAIDALMSYHWPGNVRELENVIERAILLADDGVVHAYHLPPTLQTADTSATRYMGSLEKKLDQVERETIIDALKAANGNMAQVARELGTTERVIALRIKKHGIDFRLYRRHD
jgi:Nif-specific regulatory protein